jgi:hypothetical protein
MSRALCAKAVAANTVQAAMAASVLSVVYMTIPSKGVI